MNFDIVEADRNFSFSRKPSPVPGDLRISWRISLTLLMLNASRGKKASLAKLNLLNDALRSKIPREKLAMIIRGDISGIEWRMRVEPAFGRNIDLLVGTKLADWIIANGQSSISLTEKGKSIAAAINADDQNFLEEKQFLKKFGGEITEGFVSQILLASRAPK